MDKTPSQVFNTFTNNVTVVTVSFQCFVLSINCYFKPYYCLFFKLCPPLTESVMAREVAYLEFNSLLILKPAHPQNSNLTQDIRDSVEIPLAVTVRERTSTTSMLNFALSYVLNNARFPRDRQNSFLPRVDKEILKF